MESKTTALGVMSDERLARLAAQGDRLAFGVVFDRYHQDLYRYCLSLLHDREDAADALQSTMLRALRALEGETRAIALRPWLYRIAHNESIDVLRRRPPPGDGVEALHARAAAEVESDAEARARLQQLLSDLRELPERQRGALVMRELSGLDYEQIAEAFETSPAAAKQAVYEARRALFELARGREMDCDGVRLRLSGGDRRSMRGRAVRAHLRECSDCRDFRAVTAGRRSALSSLLPGLPAAAAAKLLRGVLAGGGTGGAGTAGTASVVAGLATAAGVKSAAALTVVAAAAAGAGAGLTHHLPDFGDAEGTTASVRSVTVAARPEARPAPARAQRSRPARRHVTAPARGGGATRRRPAHPAEPASTPTATHEGDRHEGVAHPVAASPPSAAQPQPSGRRGPFGGRHAGGGSSGGGGGGGGPLAATTQVVVPQVQQGVQTTVTTVHDTVDQTVDGVTGALPIRVPRLP